MPRLVTWLTSRKTWKLHLTDQYWVRSAVLLHCLYEAYLVILHRPYILELSETGSRLANSAEACITATSRMVDQCRYIHSHFGIQTAPLSTQQSVQPRRAWLGSF